MSRYRFNSLLNDYCTSLIQELDLIPAERATPLKEIGNFIVQKLEQGHPAQLLFICTHNSRRSQFGQIWAKSAARYYGIDTIDTYSGGTEATAFNPRAVHSLERAGFKVSVNPQDRDNPVYRLQSGEFLSDAMYSKKFSDPYNPSGDFCAVMVCSQADEACPFVPGASARISLPYDDPKEFDGTSRENAAYDERCRQIASEMFYIMKYVPS